MQIHPSLDLRLTFTSSLCLTFAWPSHHTSAWTSHNLCIIPLLDHPSPNLRLMTFASPSFDLCLTFAQWPSLGRMTFVWCPSLHDFRLNFASWPWLDLRFMVFGWPSWPLHDLHFLSLANELTSTTRIWDACGVKSSAANAPELESASQVSA